MKNTNPILQALKEFGKIQVRKGQEVLCINGDIDFISEDKLITRKDFSVPTEKGLWIPKFIVSIKN